MFSASTMAVTIGRLGRSVTLRQTTEGAYDPATDSFTGSTSADEAVSAVIQRKRLEFRGGAVVEIEGLHALVAAKDMVATPKVGDLIIDGSEEYTVQKVQPRKPGGTLIAYTLDLKQ